jgi:hypothetical protein
MTYAVGSVRLPVLEKLGEIWFTRGQLLRKSPANRIGSLSLSTRH